MKKPLLVTLTFSLAATLSVGCKQPVAPGHATVAEFQDAAQKEQFKEISDAFEALPADFKKPAAFTLFKDEAYFKAEDLLKPASESPAVQRLVKEVLTPLGTRVIFNDAIIDQLLARQKAELLGNAPQTKAQRQAVGCLTAVSTRTKKPDVLCRRATSTLVLLAELQHVNYFQANNVLPVTGRAALERERDAALRALALVEKYKLQAQVPADRVAAFKKMVVDAYARMQALEKAAPTKK